MNLTEAYLQVIAPQALIEAAPPDKEEAAKKNVNPKATEMLRRRTRVIINPPLNEKKVGDAAYNPISNANDDLDNDPSTAVSDPYKALGKPKASIPVKDLAFKLINARAHENYDYEADYDELMESFEDTLEFMDEDVISEAVKKKPNTKHQKAIDTLKKLNMESGKKWHVDHPVNHMNVVNAYLDTSDKEKEFGKHWYSDAHTLTKFLSKGSGHPIQTVAGIISNHSPQNGIYQNYHDATRVLDAGKGLGGKGSGIMATKKQAEKDDRMFKGEHYNEVLKGNKIKSFAHLLEHGHQTDPSRPRVVIDRHAHSVLSGARITDNAFGMAGLKRKGRYQELENHFLNAAEHLRVHHNIQVEPEQLQATTWARQQRKNQEAEDAGYGSTKGTAKKSLGQERNWNEFAKERFVGQKLPPIPGHGFTAKAEEPEETPTKTFKLFKNKEAEDKQRKADKEFEDAGDITF